MSNWKFKGIKKGRKNFQWRTNQTLEHVKEYLDNKNINYIVHEKPKMLFIYRVSNPTSEYSERYSYYYTSGRWGDDTRTKHYSSKGIEDFIERFYKPSEIAYDVNEDKYGTCEEN